MPEGNPDLEKFITVQQRNYSLALTEIKGGRKQSHWMWYIFPQIRGLGMTEMSKRYAIQDITEAANYLRHPVLGQRLVTICQALLDLKTNDPHQVMGSPDDLKLRSCLTLFDAVPNAPPVFKQALAKFYSGKPDERTLTILKDNN